jgi:hypothetical protein
MLVPLQEAAYGSNSLNLAALSHTRNRDLSRQRFCPATTWREFSDILNKFSRQIDASTMMNQLVLG